MQDAFHMGGWGMYPTTIFGLVLLSQAILYAAAPNARRMRIAVLFAIVTGLSGVLGTVTGTIKTFVAAGQLAPHEAGNVALIGLGESLNNLALGIALIILPTLIMIAGAFRVRDHEKGELIDPRVG